MSEDENGVEAGEAAPEEEQEAPIQAPPEDENESWGADADVRVGAGVSVSEIAPFGPPHLVHGRLVFVYRDDTARRVRVSGEFNGWNPAHGVFCRQPDGSWRLEIDPLAPGRYRYRFLIDDTRWIEDPSHDAKESNPYGSMDSVLIVKPGESEGEDK
jgi:hypothetical protein